MSQEESVILCEGYHDRAFWDGLLRHVGCQSLLDANKAVKRVVDPWGDTVARGQYGYTSPSNKFVRLMPCHGDDFVTRQLESRLGQLLTKPVRHLIATYDADSDARVAGSTAQEIQSIHSSVQSAIQNALKKLNASFTTGPNGEYLVTSSLMTTTVSVVIWSTPDAHAPGMPWKQTLERLACAALNSSFQGRAQSVEQWLMSRPAAPMAGSKDYAWSHMAGWYADKGCEAFYSELWSQPAVVSELQSRLTQTGIWRIVQDVVA